MNKIAILYVEAYGDFDPYSVNMFAGRADQMEEVCKRLNANLMVGCPDIPMQKYLDETRQVKIIEDMQKNALLSKDAAHKLVDKILQLANTCTIYAEAGSFKTESVDILQEVM